MVGHKEMADLVDLVVVDCQLILFPFLCPLKLPFIYPILSLFP